MGNLEQCKSPSAVPLQGAGSWTHQYCDTANSLCSTEKRVKAPLRMLWFRDVDFTMPSRHGRGPAPLVRDGRMFMEGINGVRAVNLYNGRPLWTCEIPGILVKYHQEHLTGAANTQSNFCLGEECLYIHKGDVCLALDLATGEKWAEFPAPKRKDGKPGTWGYLAWRDGTLYGTLANTSHQMRFGYLRSDMQGLKHGITRVFCDGSQNGRDSLAVRRKGLDPAQRDRRRRGTRLSH